MLSASIGISAIGWLLESDIIGIDLSFLPFNFGTACFALVFFTLGNISIDYLLKHFLEKKRNVFGVIISFIVIVICGCVLIVFAKKNGYVSLGSRHLNNGLFLVITGCLGTACTITLSQLLRKCKFLQYCGRHSFTIMGIHIVVYRCFISCINPALNKRFPRIPILDNKQFLDGTALFIIVSAISLGFTYIYSKIVEYIKKQKRVNNNKQEKKQVD